MENVIPMEIKVNVKTAAWILEVAATRHLSLSDAVNEIVGEWRGQVIPSSSDGSTRP